jgi:hypothetical protein
MKREVDEELEKEKRKEAQAQASQQLPNSFPISFQINCNTTPSQQIDHTEGSLQTWQNCTPKTANTLVKGITSTTNCRFSRHMCGSADVPDEAKIKAYPTMLRRLALDYYYANIRASISFLTRYMLLHAISLRAMNTRGAICRSGT